MTKFPLSFAQQRLWFLDQLEPQSIAYNMPFGIRLRGVLNAVALGKSLEEVVARHEVLRTCFPAIDGEPYQQIDKQIDFRLIQVDLMGVPSLARETEMEKIASAEAHIPFVLKQGPLIRAKLISLGISDHVLLINLHHIVSDGWSTAIIVKELTTLYFAYTSGKTLPLSSLDIQYADYAVWQKDWLKGEELERQLDYWRKQLAGAPPLIDLPTDYQRSSSQRSRGRQHAFIIPAQVAQSLRKFALTEHATLYIVMLAAWKVVLWRYSNQQDIVVGSPIAGRNHVGLEGLIGFFVNTLVLRTKLAGELSFREFLTRVQQTTLDAHAHQELPFEILVANLETTRSQTYTPMFQVMFTWQNTPSAPLELQGLSIETLRLSNEVAKFDLTLAIEETDAALPASMEYSSALYQESTIIRLVDHYLNVLSLVAQNSDELLSEISLVGNSEKRQLLNLKGKTAAYNREILLPELLKFTANANPDKVAAECAGLRISYRRLDLWSSHIALQLQQLGIGVESIVGLCVERSVCMVAAIQGILKSGAAYLPLDPAYPIDRLQFMVKDSGVRLVLSMSRQTVIANSLGVEALILEEAPSLRDQTCLAKTEPEQLAYVIYTSGSTGKPKGVAISHGNLLHSTAARGCWYEQAVSSFLMLSSFSFDSSVAGLYWTLKQAGTLHLPEDGKQADVQELVQIIEREQVTHILSLPSLYAQILEEGGSKRLASLRVAIVAGEACPIELVHLHEKTLPTAELHNEYGPTEATVWATAYTHRGVESGKRVPIGIPIPNTYVRIFDTAGNLAPIGIAGELFVGGEGVSRGYLNRPALTSEKFVPDPHGLPGARLYRTGDLVRCLATGELEFVGRIDHQVKIRGYRIEPGEIEAALRAHAVVHQAVVLEGQGARKGALCGYWTAKPNVIGVAVDRELIHWLRSRLPAHMVPQYWLRVEAMPLTSNGKIDRQKLAAMEPNLGHQEIRPAEPRTELEEIVAGIWADVLRRSRVGVESNFFELGGHSLLATQVVVRMRKALEVEVPLVYIFEAPTVRRLAERVSQLRKGGAAPVPQMGRYEGSGELLLSYAQQRLWFLDQLEPGGVAYNIALGLRLRGRVDGGALERSLGGIVARHEVLRTRFVSRQGSPVQEIEPAAGSGIRSGSGSGSGFGPLVALERVDVTQGGEAAAAQLATERAGRPFDLAVGPLVRAQLLELGAEDHVLLIQLHHIVSDGWSLGIMVRELGALYVAELEGQASRLAPLAIQYGDYAMWQRGWLQGEELERQVSYWRRQLEGAPVLELGTDYARPAIAGQRGATLSFSLSPELSAGLRELSRQQGVTLFMTLLAGFQLLLSRYSGQQDIAVGTPIAGRQRAETEALIGLFVNTLVVRTRWSGEPDFVTLLGLVRARTLEAYEHQDVPFEKLVEVLQPERDMSRTPLFQIMFTLQTAPTHTLALPGLTLSDFTGDAFAPSQTVKFDLAMGLGEGEDGLQGSLEYSTDLFAAASMQELLGHYEALLARVVSNPRQRVSELSMQSPQQAGAPEVGMARGIGPMLEPDGSRDLCALIGQQDPGAVAVLAEQAQLSYGELSRRANQVGQALRQRGVAAGARVGLRWQESIAGITLAVGVLRSGATLVNLEPGLEEEILEQGKVSLVVTPAGAGAESVPASALVWAIEVEAVGEEGASGWGLPIELDSIACVQYRRSEAGVLEGVAIRHGQLGTPGFLGTMEIGAADRIVQLRSFSEEVGWIERLRVLGRGACLVLAPQLPAPGRLARLLRDRQVTVLRIGSAELERMEREFPWALKGVRQIECAESWEPLSQVAGRLRPEILDRVYGLEGSRQAGGAWMAYSLATLLAQPAGVAPAEHLAIGTKMYLLDRWLGPVADGMLGDVYLGGERLAAGYEQGGRRTAERFVPDPFAARAGSRLYRTGQRARGSKGGTLQWLRDPAAVVVSKAGRPGKEEEPVWARNAVEETVAGIWAEVLRRPRMGVETSFFELGGHSLLATQLVARIGDAFSLDLPLRRLFESPTVAGLALWIEQQRVEGQAVRTAKMGRYEGSGELLLSYAQQRLWFLDQLEPGGVAYNIALGLRLRGRVDGGALERSLGGIVARHEVLRTRFVSRQGSPVQEIEPAAGSGIRSGSGSGSGFGPLVALERVDVTQGGEAAAAQLATERAGRPFDLAVGPLVRAQLLELGAEDHVLLIQLHHIVSDGWSLGIMVRELGALYVAELEGQASRLAPLAIQYGDYAMWQRGWLQGEELERQVSYWRRQLEGAPVLELGTDYARPAIAGQRGATLSFSLSPELSAGLRELSRQQGVTLFMTLLAGFQLLLSRYSGQQDIAVGTPIAGRQRAETEALIGLFVNTLVVRTRWSGEPDFVTLLGLVRARTLEAYEHQDVPFEKLVEVLQPERDMSRTPLFQIMFTLQTAPTHTLALPGLTLSDFTGDAFAPSQTVKFDLAMGLGEGEDGLQGSLEYSTDLFAAASMQELLGHYEALLARVVSNPRQRVSELSMQSPQQAGAPEVGMARGIGPMLEPDGSRDLCALIGQQDPGAVAVLAEQAQLSYGELSRRANQVGQALRQRGVAAGARVGLRWQESIAGITLAVGVLRSGATLVNLEPGLEEEILEQGKVSLVVTPAGAGAESVPASALVWAIEVEAVGEEGASGWGLPIELDSIACVQYRRSEAGVLEGVAIRHGQLGTPGFLGTMEIGAADRIVQLRSFSEEVGWIERLRVLGRGACLVLAPQLPAPGRLARLLRDRQVTVLRIGSAELERMEREFPWALKGVRQIECAESWEPLSQVAGRLRPEILDRVYGLEGSRQAGGAWMAYSLATLLAQPAGVAPAEHLAIGTKMYLLDRWLGPVADGMLGDVYLGGERLAAGYEQGGRRTAERFVPDPFAARAGSRLYRTGQRARGSKGGTLQWLRDPAAVVVSKAGRPGKEEEPVWARNAVEETVAGIWAEVLRRPRMGVETSFFELGGHSLLATQLVARIGDAFSLDLPLRRLFESPTVAGLALWIEQQRVEGQAVRTAKMGRYEGSGELLLSYAQQRLWFLDQLEPGGVAYNIALGLRLRGRVDGGALERSLGGIVARHEVLRTRFVSRQGSPVQEIEPAAGSGIRSGSGSGSGFGPLVALERVDVTQGGEAAAAQLATERAGRPFDLAVGPLVRAQLLELGAEDHVLLIQLHHIVSDGWSLGIMVRELGALYVAELEGQASRLAPLAIQYGDYAMWQRGWLQGEELERQVSYWRRQLEGAPVLELGTDYARPAIAGQRGATLSFSLSPELSAGLRELSRQQGVTLFMTLLAGFQLLLSRYSGQQDIAVGTPIAGRQRAETEALIGLFVNTLVVRTRWSGEPDFVTLLGLVRARTLEAYEHQDVPFEKLVEVLQPERDMSRTPLFQIMFTLQTAPTHTLALPGLTLSDFTGDSQTATFDLTFTLTDSKEAILVQAQYSKDLFKASTIQRLVRHYENLLSEVTHYPDKPVGELCFMDPVEQKQILEVWNATESRLQEGSIIDGFEQQVAQTPDAIAVIDDQIQVTYKQLDRRANQVAQHLRHLGAGNETRVGVSLSRSVDLIAGLLGILKAGAAYVPLDYRNPSDRQNFILKDAQVELLLTEQSLTQGPSRVTPKIVLIEQIKQNLGDDITPLRIGSRDELAYVIYTSGSTGRAKGVMISQASLYNHVRWAAQHYDFCSDDRVLQLASVSFDAAAEEIYPTLLSGGTLILLPDSAMTSANRFNDFLYERRVTIADLPTAFWREWTGAMAASGATISPYLRVVIVGGEKASLDTSSAWSTIGTSAALLSNTYGPTEAAVTSTYYDVGQLEGYSSLPIGKPIINAQAYVLDDSLRPVPVNVRGNLFLGGAGLARGYFNHPRLTAENFIPNPFSATKGERLYRTGDLARWIEDGNLEFLGRSDNQVKIRGFRIELGEIEAALESHTGVREAVAVLHRVVDRDPAVWAYIVAMPAAPKPDFSEVLRAVSKLLPDYMVPTRLMWVDRVPLTASGKVDHALLASTIIANEQELEHDFRPARDEVEERLVQIWEEMLDKYPIQITDNFFKIGGHSLLVIRLVARLEKCFDKRISIAAFFRSPTVEQLAELIREEGVQVWSPLVALRPTGIRPPLFLMHTTDGTVLPYLDLVSDLDTEQPVYGLEARPYQSSEASYDRLEDIAAEYVTAIKKLHPSGPYLLGGWSFGGLIALEVAQQMRLNGDTIPLLVLLDTVAPQLHSDLPSELSDLAGFALQLGCSREQILSAAADFLEPSSSTLLPILLAMAKATGRLPADMTMSEMSARFDRFRTYSKLTANYRSKTYSGPTSLLRAKDGLYESPSVTTEDLEWQQAAILDLQISWVPGDHFSMLRKPNAAALANVMSTQLRHATRSSMALSD